MVYADQDTPKAIAILKRLMVQRPRDVDSWLELAQLLESVNSLQAIETYQKANQLLVEAGDIQLPLLNNMAALHHFSGDVTSAEKAYEWALKHCQKDDPLYNTLQYNMARLHEERGDTDKAKGVYKSILESNPQYVDGTLIFIKLISSNVAPWKFGAKCRESARSVGFVQGRARH
jgi:RNA polymerase-associated protein CTR9